MGLLKTFGGLAKGLGMGYLFGFIGNYRIKKRYVCMDEYRAFLQFENSS